MTNSIKPGKHAGPKETITQALAGLLSIKKGARR